MIGILIDIFRKEKMGSQNKIQNDGEI